MLAKEASQISRRLGGDVVKVESVSNRVDNGEKDAPAGGVLVEMHQRIQWNVVMNGRDGSKLRRHMAAAGQQDDGEGKHHSGSRTSSDCDAPTGCLPESDVLSLYPVRCRKKNFGVI